MILHRIREFQTYPAWYEYFVLYTVTCTSFVVLCLSIMQRLPAVSGGIALIILLGSLYISAVIHRVRKQRAIDFFCQCIENLNHDELVRLSARVQPYELEYTFLQQRIRYFKKLPL